MAAVRSVVRCVKNHPFKNDFKIAAEVSSTSGVPLYTERYIQMGYMAEPSSYRQLIRHDALVMQKIYFWNNILFSHESKFVVFGKKKHVKV